VWETKVPENRHESLVAVVTPVYNGERYLAETMACVQAQTYGSLIHIILDNASVDGTAGIVNSFMGRRVPVVYYRNSEPIACACNWEAAIRLVPREAQYFRVLCGDDLMTSESIEKMVTVGEADRDIGMVGCKFALGRVPYKADYINPAGLPQERNVFDGRWVLKGFLVGLHHGLSPCHTLMRRRCLDDDKPFYDPTFFCTDTEACLRLMTRYKYGFVHDVIGWTRLHDESRTSLLADRQVTLVEGLLWMDRFGPLVMNPAELVVCRRAYLRHHFRRMLLWRFKERNKAKYDRHLEFLQTHSVGPNVRDYAEALIEWCWLAMANRRDQVGAARSLWASTWAELKSQAVSRRVV
jgi:glycosyltransferase involved in cell wall biosynthesis